jgi:hypothetical protein
LLRPHFSLVLAFGREGLIMCCSSSSLLLCLLWFFLCD